MSLIPFLAASCIDAGALAQNLVPCTAMPVAGTEANGKDYRPTSRIVAPVAQRRATDREPERTDKSLLRQQGMNAKSGPNFNAAQ